jgi:hypothetical protein
MFDVDDLAFQLCIPLAYPQGNFGPNQREPTSETTFLDAGADASRGSR